MWLGISGRHVGALGVEAVSFNVQILWAFHISHNIPIASPEKVVYINNK